MIAVGCYNGNIHLVDAATIEVKRALSGHSDGSSPVSCLAFKPGDPNILVSGSWDKTLKIWDLSTAACVLTVTVDSLVESVAFSPDGSIIAAAHSNEIQLFDAQTQEKIGSPLRGHDCKNGCICDSYSDGSLSFRRLNPDCPVSGHSDR